MKNFRKESFFNHKKRISELSEEFNVAADTNAKDDFYSDELREEDLTFWVDPLDGSKGFS